MTSKARRKTNALGRREALRAHQLGANLRRLPRERIPKNIVEAALAGRKLHVPTGAEMAIDHIYIEA